MTIPDSGSLSTHSTQSTNSTLFPIYNALSIDVEDYFMVSAFADVVKFEEWGRFESRVEKNTLKILELLDEFDTKATFFTLGWVAERYPGLVKEISSKGHEIASHGYNHRLVYNCSPDEFREDIRKTKHILEDITSSPVMGFRAASYSIVKETLWALDILIEEGYAYDSSIFPIYHDRYGIPDAERYPYIIKGASKVFWEFPPSTYRIFGNNIPMAGGGYFRLYPYQLTKMLINSINQREEQPVIFYLHPWEIDAEQPRMKGSSLSVLRHYSNLAGTSDKLRRLLMEFHFKPIASFMETTVS